MIPDVEESHFIFIYIKINCISFDSDALTVTDMLIITEILDYMPFALQILTWKYISHTVDYDEVQLCSCVAWNAFL